MTAALARQRCFHHASREAVSRCPRCRRFFCRECITEHSGQVLCASCLAANAALVKPPRSASAFLLPLALLAGLLLAWLFFYYFGVLLTKMPSSFHQSSPA